MQSKRLSKRQTSLPELLVTSSSGTRRWLGRHMKNVAAIASARVQQAGCAQKTRIPVDALSRRTSSLCLTGEELPGLHFASSSSRIARSSSLSPPSLRGRWLGELRAEGASEAALAAGFARPAAMSDSEDELAELRRMNGYQKARTGASGSARLFSPSLTPGNALLSDSGVQPGQSTSFLPPARRRRMGRRPAPFQGCATARFRR